MAAVKQPKRNYTEKDLIGKIDKLEGEIKDLKDMVRTLADKVSESKPPKKKEYVYGIKGIAQIFGCSTATAQRIKSSGVIDGAITQRNRRIIVDVEKAMTYFNDPFSKWGLRDKTKLK